MINESIAAGVSEGLQFRGRLVTEHWRQSGGIYRLHDRIVIPNLVVNVGKNDNLAVYFRGGTQNIHWYMGLMNNAGFAAVVATDTMAAHPGWTELTTYSEATRPEWVTAAPAGQSISNPSPIVMTINAGGTVKGVFITTSSTKGGAVGTLWSGAPYAAPIVVSNTDILRNTYTVSC